MGQLDIPSVEFIEMIAGTGAGRYGCKASADLFGLTKDDLIGQVKDIIRVGESMTSQPADRSSSPERH
jgi:peroxiredoxin family protein